MDKVLLTVGNSMMGDDGAGELLARMLQKTPVTGWIVLHGGSAPENLLHNIGQISPSHVIVVDAADMDLPPGSIRVIPKTSLQNPFFFTTHTLPLTFLIEALEEYAQLVTFVGIQPAIIAFGCPISSAVTQSVEAIYKRILENPAEWHQNIATLEGL